MCNIPPLLSPLRYSAPKSSPHLDILPPCVVCFSVHITSAFICNLIWKLLQMSQNGSETQFDILVKAKNTYQIDVAGVNCEFYEKIPFWIGQGHKLKRAFLRRKDRKRQQPCMQRSRDRKPVFNFSLKIWKNVWPQQRPTLSLKGTISDKYLSHPRVLWWKINKTKK